MAVGEPALLLSFNTWILWPQPFPLSHFSWAGVIKTVSSILRSTMSRFHWWWVRSSHQYHSIGITCLTANQVPTYELKVPNIPFSSLHSSALDLQLSGSWMALKMSYVVHLRTCQLKSLLWYILRILSWNSVPLALGESWSCGHFWQASCKLLNSAWAISRNCLIWYTLTLAWMSCPAY